MRMACSCPPDCKATTEYHRPFFHHISELANSSVAPWNLMWVPRPAAHFRSAAHLCNSHTLIFSHPSGLTKELAGSPVSSRELCAAPALWSTWWPNPSSWRSKCSSGVMIGPIGAGVLISWLLVAPVSASAEQPEVRGHKVQILTVLQSMAVLYSTFCFSEDFSLRLLTFALNCLYCIHLE